MVKNNMLEMLGVDYQELLSTKEKYFALYKLVKKLKYITLTI
jgi:hypothetical protein